MIRFYTKLSSQLLAMFREKKEGVVFFLLLLPLELAIS